VKLRLYIDEDASRSALVKALRDATIDVVTTLEAENLGCPDSEQLVWATQNNRAIYTYNMRDFCRLHSIYMTHTMEHSGIVIAERQSYSIGEQLRGIQNLVASNSVEQMKNQLVFLGNYIRLE